MQIVSNGDNLLEISNPVFWEKSEKLTNMSSAELAQRVIKVKDCILTFSLPILNIRR